MRYCVSLLAGAGAVCVGAGSVSASSISFSGAAGSREAMATFETSGSDLVVTLVNSSGADVLVPVDVLTAVFFDIQGDPLALVRESAVLASGSEVLFGISDPGGVVGGEWAYASGLNGPDDARYGISSSGLDSFGPHDRFPGNNLDGPVSPGGLNYGLTSTGDDPATGNAPVTGGNPLIQDAVVLTLSGLPDGFNPATAISHVSFQYGTSLSEPRIPGVPAPSSLALLGAGLLIIAARRRH